MRSSHGPVLTGAMHNGVVHSNKQYPPGTKKQQSGIGDLVLHEHTQ